VELQHIYRTLDYLATNNDIIQTHIYNKNRNLFNYQLDVVFYDVTTFYFDSEVQKEGALRQLGYGKDGKTGKTQILFSLLIDKTKCPLAFKFLKVISTKAILLKVPLINSKPNTILSAL